MKQLPEGFHIHKAKGFHMIFANGCTASVQFGWSNNCGSNQIGFGHQPEYGIQSPDAEVAAWDADGEWIHPEGFDFAGDDIIGNLSPDEVARFIQAVKDHPNGQG